MLCYVTKLALHLLWDVKSKIVYEHSLQQVGLCTKTQLNHYLIL
jgi:hypothetical protein